MGHGALSVFSTTIASGASTSGGISLARAWNKIFVQVGTMSTAAAISVQVSPDTGTTWYDLFHSTVQSATVATPKVFIASGVGTNGGTTPLPAGGLNYVRFLATAVVSGGVAFKLICSD